MESTLESKAFAECAAATAAIMNPAIEDWRAGGGKVVGYFCSHVPTEVLTAAGILPFRMRGTGSTGTELSDAFFSSINCSFPRHTFNLALQGEYDFLDGLVCISSCDHVRRVYDNWKRNIPTPYLTVMSLPRKVEDAQVGWYRDEINVLRNSLAEHFGIEISDEKLWEAIDLHDGIRQLQRKIYKLRKGATPISGAEALAVMVAGTALPKPHYKKLLEELLAELEQAAPKKDYRARLLVVGSELDDPGWIQAIEDQGGLVVADSICFGSREMWGELDRSISDPARALAQYYIQDHPSCPRMYGDQPRRRKYLMDMIREFEVDGVIGERMMFCDQWCVEHYMNDLDLKEEGIPFLQLDREYITSGKGQLRTRIQAFLETMGK